MLEYKVIHTTVRDAEEEMNRLAEDGWRVVSTTTVSGSSFTINSTPLIVTLERERRI